jgi:hypothetical protein
MSNLARLVGQFVRDRIFRDDEKVSENDISEYLYQREEIALRSLQDSLKALKKFELDAETS